MQITDPGRSPLATLTEFLANALGPAYEIVLYELNADGSGTVQEAEMTFLFPAESGDPMPDDIASLIQRTNLDRNSYITGLTAMVGGGKVCNLSLLFIPKGRMEKDRLLAMYWDSTEYFDMALKLFKMSNLNNKIDLPVSAAEAIRTVSASSMVNIPIINHVSEKQADWVDPADSLVSSIDTVIAEVMGSQIKEQPAYTQDKRTEIVERLYSMGLFNIKGMVKTVSEKLYCSSASVYRYISSIAK